MQKVVSVIIPAYNAAKTIVQTLESVLSQSYENLEIIVINDGSTDDTVDLLGVYRNNIKLISTENKGVSNARELGFKESNGEYIQYLDADDLLSEDKLTIQLKALQDNDAGVAYGDWQKFSLVNYQLSITETISRKIEGDLELALFGDFWCPPAAILYSRKTCEKLTWNKELPVIQDARYFLDAAIVQSKFVYTPGVMAQYRSDRAQSLSQQSDVNFLKDLYTNTKEVYHLWQSDFEKHPAKKEAIFNSLRHCINRLSVLDRPLAKEAISLLLTLAPNYLPPESGALRTFTKIVGYKNAEKIAGLKRSLRR